MKQFYPFILFVILLCGCRSSQQNMPDRRENWVNIAVTEDEEVFTDTASIRKEGAVAYAREKRVYTTTDSRKVYTDRIKAQYAKLGKPEKAQKWYDFSYCIYECEYECTNKRFRILSVSDYDSTGKLILKTTSSKKNIRWLNVDTETVGDYTFFFVCDYDQ